MLNKTYSAKIISAFSFLIILTNKYSSIAQISPAQNAKLNYTQIMFEYEKINGAAEYMVQVSEGTIDKRDGDGFAGFYVTQKDSTTATLIQGFEFGKKYNWRYAGFVNGKATEWKGPYQFEILNDTAVFKNKFRVRVNAVDSSASEQGLFLLDYAHVAVDRKGKPVWFLPSAQFKDVKKAVVRDLRLSKAGTFTFLTDTSIYESDLNGNLLWQGPNDGKVSGEKSEFYHHDFQLLPNGHYIVLGQKYSWRQIPAAESDTKYRAENTKIEDGRKLLKIMFGTIIEYDSKGKIVWSWNSADYFKDEDVFSKESSTNTPRRAGSPEVANAELFGHLNSVEQDSAAEYVYAGFRDVSRIVKIEKKTGKVVRSWGTLMPSGEASEGNGFFKNQHGSQILRNGNIATFNNNGLNDFNNASNIVVFTQPKQKGKSEVVWQFDCKFDTITNGKSGRNGNVEELSNGNFVSCFGGINRIVEIKSKDKKVVWDAFVENVPLGAPTWMRFPQYRVHYASSLYPLYFTISSDKDVLDNAKEPFTITIYNEGTEPDSYVIHSKNSSEKNVVTPVILPGKSYKIETSSSLPFVNFAQGRGEVLVSSSSNKKINRRLTIMLK